MSVKIFIVDDEMVFNLTMAEFLEKNGYKAEMYKSGEECIDSLDSGNIPDLILMDINLGPNRMDGPEVTKKIYKKYDIPVVLHSAYTDKKTIDRTRDMTKYGYIQKTPGNEQFVLATIEMALKLHQTEGMYRELSSHLQQVREEEKASIAREIHDDLGQSMTALKINVTMLEKNLTSVPECDGVKKLRSITKDVKSILEQTGKKIRFLTQELRPPVLDTMNVLQALEWQASEFEEQFRTPVRYEKRCRDLDFNKTEALTIFRIVQEALTNSVRHADPGQIIIAAEENQNNLIISVSDDGCGFEPEKQRISDSYGLIGMQERAKGFGFKLSVHSKKGEGTAVRVSIPIRSQDDSGSNS